MLISTATAAAPRQWFDCQHGGDKSRIQIQRAMDKAEVEEQLADMREEEIELAAEGAAMLRDIARMRQEELVDGMWDTGYGIYPV